MEDFILYSIIMVGRFSPPLWGTWARCWDCCQGAMDPDQASTEPGELGKDGHRENVGSDIWSHKCGLGGDDVPQPGHRVERRRPPLPLAAQLGPGIAAINMWHCMCPLLNKNYLLIIFVKLFCFQDSQMVGVGSSSSNNQAVLQQRQMEDKMVTLAHTFFYYLL